MKSPAVLFLMVATALGQGDHRTPSLDEIFADVATLRDRVDARAVVVLKARYERNARQLALLERLEASAQRGVPITVPPTLRGEPVEGASPELEARERAKRDELAARLVAAGRGGDVSPNLSDRPTILGSALVGALEMDATPPTSRPTAPPDPKAVRRGRLEAALAQLLDVPTERRSTLETFRAASLLHELGRTGEAEPLYRLVAERDEGHLRSQAQWMLDLSRQRQELKTLVEKLGTPTTEAKR